MLCYVTSSPLSSGKSFWRQNGPKWNFIMSRENKIDFVIFRQINHILRSYNMVFGS